MPDIIRICKVLYLIPFLHQTTTLILFSLFRNCCILFHFYIKPQLLNISVGQAICCILFHFYIKPQLVTLKYSNKFSCILFHFYIKPQLPNEPIMTMNVVSYSISTSNHNCISCFSRAIFVVSYSISTSNHNT